MSEEKQIVEYKTDHGLVKISPSIVRRYLVSGNGKVSDEEIVMFIQLCRFQGLNPFLREAYLIKFGTEPATMVTGKDTFTKRASKIKECRGYNAGTVVLTKEGKIERHLGSVFYDGETLIGGWAKVYRENWQEPLDIEVSLKEYMRTTREGKPMANWAKMPATMIRKVALVQALREAFPSEYQGLYSPEEMPVDPSKLSEVTVIQDETKEVKNETFQSQLFEKLNELALIDGISLDKFQEKIGLKSDNVSLLSDEEAVDWLARLDEYK